jgi:pimeloyl-ACP methyl ester carboxylesterase
MPARSIDDYAADVLALMDHLDIGRAVVGGLSMGGYVTFGVCRLAPERVGGLVLADTRAEADTDEARANREGMLAALEASGVSAVSDVMLPKLLGSTTRRENPALVSEVRRLMESNAPAPIADAIRCLMSRPDSTPLLASLRVPALLIVGREDELTPVALHEQMQSALPDAALTVIENAGHLSNAEDPEVFNRSLSRFLSSWS